jgi:glyoxylase-like metal-dependent hydrolase (beta-lactamase superfamily II)
VAGALLRNTCALVRDGDARLVVDPGTLTTPEILLDALRARGLGPDDITHVYVTHYHMDHVRYIGLFARATVIDFEGVYAGEQFSLHAGEGYAVTPNTRILFSPGHTPNDTSLLVRTAVHGRK